jgi:hypothetical protein
LQEHCGCVQNDGGQDRQWRSWASTTSCPRNERGWDVGKKRRWGHRQGR